MNQREMLMYDKTYKKSVLAIMNTIANIKDRNITKVIDPRLFYKTIEDTVIKMMKDNEDIKKDSMVYKLVERSLPILLYGNIQFGANGIIHTISSDMVYNTDNKGSYNGITLRCTIFAKDHSKRLTDIEISPSIKISYNNRTTIYYSNPIWIKDESYYSFNQIYINAINSLNGLIDDTPDMKNIISKITDIDIEYLLQDMAMLITLYYMRAIIPIDDYPKFLKMDEPKEDKDCIATHIDKNIDLIRSILYNIGKVDITLLNRALGKMNRIMKNAQNEAISIMKKKINE